MPEPRQPPPTEHELKLWPTKGRAASMVGMSTWYIVKAVKRGDLNEYQSEDGFKRYDPDEIDLLKNVKVANEQLMNEMLDCQGSALKQAHHQILALTNLVIDPKRDSIQAVLEDNKDLRTELKELREECRQMRNEKREAMVAMENLLSQGHMRELAASAVKQEQARTDKAWDGLLKFGPKLLSQFAMGATLKKFVESLRPEQVMFLKETEGFLDEEQQTRLGHLLEKYNQYAKDEAESPDSGSNGAGQSSTPASAETPAATGDSNA